MFINFVSLSKTNKEKSTEIVSLLLLTPLINCTVYAIAIPESQKKVKKRSSLKEDESALLIYLLFSLWRSSKMFAFPGPVELKIIFGRSVNAWIRIRPVLFTVKIRKI